MKTGIDYRPALLSRTGIGRHTREITAAMAEQLGVDEELSLFGVSLASGSARLPRFENGPERGRTLLVRRRFPARLLHILGRLGLMGVETFTGPLDLFLYTDVVYPPLKGARHVVTVYDLAFLRSGQFHGKGFARVLWKRMEPVLDSAAAILVPSPATADDVRTFAPACAGKVRLVPLGGDHLLPPGAGAPVPPEILAGMDSFFLAVGTLEPRKNWERVLHAFESAAPDLDGAGLLFAGTPGWLYTSFLENLKASPVRDRVRFVDALSDEILAALYDRAIALVYPSLWEGFGLPVAEALFSGCPVITSNRASLPWLAGRAALVVDPEDGIAIAGAMRRICRERGLRDELSAAARERSQEFTWKKTAAATLEILRHEASR
jgi:glycosyltransferase involved in cell wall biosynthesis